MWVAGFTYVIESSKITQEILKMNKKEFDKNLKKQVKKSIKVNVSQIQKNQVNLSTEHDEPPIAGNLDIKKELKRPKTGGRFQTEKQPHRSVSSIDF